MSAKPVTAICIGVGVRGTGYSEYAHSYPDKFKVVGVADPRTFYRERLRNQHKIPESNVFCDWKEVAEREKFADCVIIATPDRLHKDPALAFAKKGYHVLLEKPMAVYAEDCRDIVKTCQDNNVMLAVCHVLRYTPWARKLKELIDSGVIGDVVNIQHLEPVGFWHFAHSYVRGNWHNEEKSSCSLLAKCCHDVDLISYWMGSKKCNNVSSFGSLSHFNKENKPKGAASRCLDCPKSVETNCPYSAIKIYLDEVSRGYTGWPIKVIAEEPTVDSVTEALKSGPYGKCVYDLDNDVMSNQVVNMQFEGGATASLTMMAFTENICCREVSIFGTKGELRFKDQGDAGEIQHYDFLTRKRTNILADAGNDIQVLGGHGGADFHCMDSFIKAISKGDKSVILTGPEESLASHLLVFAAEKARKENTVVTINADMTF